MHSMCGELVVLALAAIDVVNDAIVAGVETLAALRNPRPAAKVDTSADSDTVIRTRVAIAWALVALTTTMVCPTAFVRDVFLECLRGVRGRR